jgi:predicted PurR-regulated permease PerM
VGSCDLCRAHRGRAHEVLGTLGQTLRGWLLGQFGVMVINGVLTWLGLMLIGVPQAALLGVITGVLNFIPNLGPFLAAVPALLLALSEGPTQVLSVLALFVLIQNLEGFVLTPLVQQRTVDIPPALLLTAQVLLGVLFGFSGCCSRCP